MARSTAKLAHRGQLVPAAERTGGNPAAHLVHDLPVYRHAAVQVQMESKLRLIWESMLIAVINVLDN